MVGCSRNDIAHEGSDVMKVKTQGNIGNKENKQQRPIGQWRINYNENKNEIREFFITLV